MKQLTTFHIVMLASFLSAQSYCPILVNERMNYRHTDSTIITHTIWVDSIDTSGSNLIYHLNLIVKDVPNNPEIVLWRQPQFLLKQMEDQDNGIYRFNIPGEFTINSLAMEGETWIFDPGNDVTAEVTSLITEDILGVQDSVKLIWLSNGYEIRLSKSFGIIKFPDIENGGYFELVGIQNTEFGESVPDFWDIYNFEVGDVFQTYSYYSDAGNYEAIEEWNKRTINSKEKFADHYNYNVYSITFQIYYGYGGYTSYYHSSYTLNDNYYFSDHPIASKFQNDSLYLFEAYGCSPNYSDQSVYSRIKVYPDPNGLMAKQYGTLANDWTQYEELFYPNTPQNDTLNILTTGECLTDVPHGLRYTESLGNTFTYYCDHFEVWYYDYLMGYIKDGVTYGIIYPDSFFLVGTELHLADPDQRISVYPNPANEYVNFKFVPALFTTNCTIEIMNLMDEIVTKQERKGTELCTLDVANLKPGLYFYMVKDNNAVIQHGKLVIR